MRNPLDIYPWRVRNPLEVAEVRNSYLCICSTGTEGLVSRENLFHDVGTVAGKPFSGNGEPGAAAPTQVSPPGSPNRIHSLTTHGPVPNFSHLYSCTPTLRTPYL